MDIQALGTVLLSDQPREDAKFYITHFGFEAVAELDWYVSLRHPQIPQLFLDLMNRNHPASAESLRGRPTSGVLLGLLVADVEAQAQRLQASGLLLSKAVTDEPWGQRRFQVEGPGGIVVEVLQRIPPDPEWLNQNGG